MVPMDNDVVSYAMLHDAVKSNQPRAPGTVYCHYLGRYPYNSQTLLDGSICEGCMQGLSIICISLHSRLSTRLTSV